MKIVFKIIPILIFATLFTACQSTKNLEQTNQTNLEIPLETESDITSTQNADKNSITLLFGGDIMAHSVNYKITDISKIYRDVKDLILPADLAFANVEAPLDSTKPTSSYPDFNMSKEYLSCAIDAGFDVFSLCNNHTNDQGLDGIKETVKSTKEIEKNYLEKNNAVYFSGLREKDNSAYSYNLIEKSGWKILFLPMTELLNRPSYSSYINFVPATKKAREEFISYVKKLREENHCDLFILSFHTAEPEYVRKVTKSQKDFYLKLLDSGVDVVWANHAHLIRDREFVFNSKTGSQKLIMYGNGNVISGQRLKPDFETLYPDLERDNTGDGLLYEVTFTKRENKSPEISKVQQFYITTYINTAYEFVLKKLDQSTIMYCNEVKRFNWAKYLERRIIVNEKETKDLILWQ